MKTKLTTIIIVVLCIIASVSCSFWYRANQVLELKSQIEKTEIFLLTINWNEQTIDYLNGLGYDIPEPVQISQEPSKEGER